MTTTVSPKRVQKTLLPSRRPSGESDDGKKDHPCSGGFLSNDGFLWTDTNSDLKLIEPRILVSVNHNYLEFSRKGHRPPERRTLCLTNHGDHPIAFQVMTTDNYSYFVDRKHGIIPPRQCSVNAALRMANLVNISVYRRPHEEYNDPDKAQFYNTPHKDKMVILLAPQMCQTFSPQAIFHNERCHEKLRIMLRYTGIEEKPTDKIVKEKLLHIAPGWKTWQEDTCEQKKETNALQIAEFKKQETKLINNVSREQIDDQQNQQLLKPRVPYKKYTFNTPKHSKTPQGGTPNETGKKKESGVLKKVWNNLFRKEETPMAGSPGGSKAPTKPQLKSDEVAKKPATSTSQGSVEMPKKTSTDVQAVSPGVPPSKRLESNEQATPKQARKSMEDKKDRDTPTPEFLKKSREARKAMEQEKRVTETLGKEKKDAATPPIAKKSLEKDRKDAPTPPLVKKSQEKGEKKGTSPDGNLQEAHSPALVVEENKEVKENKENLVEVTQSPKKKSIRGTSPVKTKEE